jgi:tetratricopeptide (TPR) repeat protein
VLLACGLAVAQSTQPGQPGRKKYKAQPLNLHRQAAGASAADSARARMKSGDLNGALDAFDAALASSSAPTLYRDRGLCHEKLGHPYPAMDDYRSYLTGAPSDAADADDIRDRLARLEDEASGGPPRAADDTNVPSATPSAEAGPSVAPPGGSAAGRDRLEYVEPDEDALRTSLRRGKGWSIAPFLSVRAWFGGFPPGGDSSSAECVGVQVRYSTGMKGALVLEAGYEPFNSTDANLDTMSGLSSQVAYELRFPLDPEYNNQILFAPGLGYEHLEVTPTSAQATSYSVGAFVPRVRIGVRHLLRPATAIDFSLDGGVANFFAYSSFPYDSNASLTGFLAVNVSVAWGL